MVPCLHAASVDHMPGCSLSLPAGRAASPRASVIFIFCHVIPAYWPSWDCFFFFSNLWSVCEVRAETEKESACGLRMILFTPAAWAGVWQGWLQQLQMHCAHPSPYAPPLPPSLITPSSHLSRIVWCHGSWCLLPAARCSKLGLKGQSNFSDSAWTVVVLYLSLSPHLLSLYAEADVSSKQPCKPGVVHLLLMFFLFGVVFNSAASRFYFCWGQAFVWWIPIDHLNRPRNSSLHQASLCWPRQHSAYKVDRLLCHTNHYCKWDGGSSAVTPLCLVPVLIGLHVLIRFNNINSILIHPALARSTGLRLTCVIFFFLYVAWQPTSRAFRLWGQNCFFGSWFLSSGAGFSGWVDYAALSCLVSDNSTMMKSSRVMN